MAGKGFESTGLNVIEDLWDEIDKLHKRTTHLQNNRQPTQPLYDFTSGAPGDLPDDPIEGQYAVDKSTDTGYLYSNGAWHPIGTNQDAWPVNEDVVALSPGSNTDSFHWAVVGTVDSLCLYNGYLLADGTQNAYIKFRFNIGPFGSVHDWSLLYRRGPDYGIATIYLASIPEDDPSSGAADPTGVLKDISTLTWVQLPGVANAYNPTVDRNIYQDTNTVRVMGQPGDPLTAMTFDGTFGSYNMDGGPGPYAMMLKMETTSGSSYKFGLQALHRKRHDWAFG